MSKNDEKKPLLARLKKLGVTNASERWGVDALKKKIVELEAKAPAEEGVVAEKVVTVRITKKGTGCVYTGAADGSTFEWEDKVDLPASTALSLEDRAYAEILE